MYTILKIYIFQDVLFLNNNNNTLFLLFFGKKGVFFFIKSLNYIEFY